MVAPVNIYDEFREWAEAQELFDKRGCVCGGRAPTNYQGEVEDDVHHEPFCPVPRFLDVMWAVVRAQEKCAADKLFRAEINKAINRIMTNG